MTGNVSKRKLDHESMNEKKHTVDSVDERNPTKVDLIDITVFIGFYTSQVVQDFFQRQYERSNLHHQP